VKHIEFMKIACENYCRYQELVDLEFKPGTIRMIVGKNGVGKSTLFSIIPFTLYGMTQTGLRGEDAINRKTKKNCHTHVTFKINDDIYTCDRYLKYTKMGASKVILTKNGKAYKSGNNEVVAEIENLIMPRQLFFNTVLFGQKVTTFFTDLTDSEQKNIFRKILNLEVYSDYQKVTGEKIKEIDHSLSNTIHDIDTLKKLIEEYESQIKDLEELRVNFEKEKEENIQRHQNEIVSVEKNIETLMLYIKTMEDKDVEKILETHSKMITSVEGQISLLQEKAEGYINLIKEKEKNVVAEITNKYNQEYQDVTREINDVKFKLIDDFDNQNKEKNNQISSLLEKKGKLEGSIIELETLKKQHSEFVEKYTNLLKASSDVPCPMCLRPLGVENNPKLVKKCEEIKNQIEKINHQIDELTTQKNDLINKINKLREEIEKLTNDKSVGLTNIEAKIGSFEKDWSERRKKEIQVMSDQAQNKLTEAQTRYQEKKKDLQNQLESAKVDFESAKHDVEKLNDYRKGIEYEKTKIENIKKSISEIKNSIFDTSMIEKNSEKIIDCQKKIKIQNEEIKNLQNLKQVYEFWKIGFSSAGIPSMLIDEAIPFMNIRVNEYLDMISGGRYIVSFDTLQETKSGEFRDKFNIRFYDNETHADGRKLLSGGQTRIVDIATILTLSDLQEYLQGVSINIMLFDEIFDSLDNENIQNVSKVLRSIIKNKSLNIISHQHIDEIDAEEILKL